MQIVIVIASFVAGYVASIYTWPYFRTTVVGVEVEANALRSRANNIMASFRKPPPAPPPTKAP